MKSRKEINIANLTSLWETAGKPFGGCFREDTFNHCKIPDSDWPNKLWLNKELKHDYLKDIEKNILSSRLAFPYWDDFNSPNFEIIAHSRLVKKSEQVGMSLKLGKKFKESERLEFIQASEPQTAQIWAALYPQSFGYHISGEIINRTAGQIQFYLAVFKNTPIGTAIAFQTGNVIGIHGVGVVPEMRRMGFAEEIMRYLLNKAIDQKSEYAVLQASALGRGIYLKMGFSEDFLMANYVPMSSR